MFCQSTAARLARFASSAAARASRSSSSLRTLSSSTVQPARPRAFIQGTSSAPFAGSRNEIRGDGLVGCLDEALLRSHFHSSTLLQDNRSGSAQVSQADSIHPAWDGIISGAVEASRQYKAQVLETEHLMQALLEQKDGLAKRIFSKAGIDNTTVLHATDEFISQQSKVYLGVTEYFNKMLLYNLGVAE